MNLKPTIKLVLGNFLYESQVSQVISTSLFLPEINRVRAVIPAKVALDAATGDEGELTLDNGEGEKTILTGKIRSIHRSLFKTEVTVTDSSADLNGYRPAVTYEKQNAKDIIKALASDIDAPLDTIDIDLPLAAYVAHQNRTAAEHIACLAKLSGAFAHINNQGKLRVSNWPEGQSDVVLSYGREILEYTLKDNAGTPGQPITIGSGPAGSNEAPDALRHTISQLPGDAPAPGSDAVWKPVAILRTPAAATGAARAVAKEKLIYEKQFHAKCILNPTLQPGMVLEIQELPDEVTGGPWIIVKVSHHLQANRGGSTRLEGVTAEGGSGASLASLASAAGGL